MSSPPMPVEWANFPRPILFFLLSPPKRQNDISDVALLSMAAQMKYYPEYLPSFKFMFLSAYLMGDKIYLSFIVLPPPLSLLKTHCVFLFHTCRDLVLSKFYLYVNKIFPCWYIHLWILYFIYHIIFSLKSFFSEYAQPNIFPKKFFLPFIIRS